MYINTAYHATPTQMTEEAQQVEAAKLDPQEFEPLYRKYYEPIFRFVYQRLDSKDTAFDVVSQVFLKAMLNIKRYRFKGVPFSSWLYRIAYNELNDVFRKRKAQRTINVNSEDLAHIAEEVTKDDGRAQRQEQVIEMVNGLEDDDLLLIEMRYFEKRPFKEIGEILEITENNAKVKVYRIIEKLRKQVK